MANNPTHTALLNSFLAHSIRHNYENYREGPRQFLIETNDGVKFDVWAQCVQVDPTIEYEILSWRVMNWGDRPTDSPNEEL